MAHIFFERLERRRSTQTLLGGGLSGELSTTRLPGGWSGNRSPISSNLMMPFSAGDTYPLNLSSSFLWDSGLTQYSPVSNMNLYNQSTRSSISSLMSNLFTTPQQSWVGIRSMGDTWSYQPVSLRYSDIFAPATRDYWSEPVVIYGMRTGFPQEIGYPWPHATSGGGKRIPSLGESLGDLPYPISGVYYGIDIYY